MPKIKFCGMTRVEDMKLAVELGSDYFGMIFSPVSKRYIPPSRAQKFIRDLQQDHPHFQTRKVGVFVNEEIDNIKTIVHEVNLDVVQLHGEEDQDFIGLAKKKMPNIAIWKAIRVIDQHSISVIDVYRHDFFLIDRYVSGNYGGTGESIDRDVAAQWCALQKQGMKIMVAGGLNHDNIGGVLSLSPWGVDINSGVEDAPGVKNHEKMRQMVKHINDFFSH